MAYKFISEMHIGRARSARRWADRYYAIAKRAGEAGDLIQSLISRAKANRCYIQAHEYEELARRDRGKTFEKKGRGGKLKPMPEEENNED